MERYMVLEPTGEIRWIQTEHEDLLDTLHREIGCDCVECVRTVVPDIALIVDESGKVKEPPQLHNRRASELYAGWTHGIDIAGPAVLVAIHWVGGEREWVPLNELELRRLKALGISADKE